MKYGLSIRFIFFDRERDLKLIIQGKVISTNFSQSTPKIILPVHGVWNKFSTWTKNNRLELIWVMYYIFEAYGYTSAVSQGKQTWLTSKNIDFNNISDVMDLVFHLIILVGLSIYFLISKAKERNS